MLTITSAIGASALGCAPSKQAPRTEPLAETGPVADPEEGFTYKSACCSVNCTSRCHLRARVKDDKIYTVTPGQMLDATTTPTAACAPSAWERVLTMRACASCIP